MDSLAVVLARPGHLELQRLDLEVSAPDEEVIVDVEWSGISTGTERLLYTGQMPPFPGLGYPLVPGYETVGRVLEAPAGCPVRVGDRVFVPGASCFGPVRGLFGGAASRLRVPASRVTPIHRELAERGVLLALASTAYHALAAGDRNPDLIVGHGALGRLLARLAVMRGGAPVVWEKDPVRAAGAAGYDVLSPEADARRDYQAIYDVSGDASLVEDLIGRLGRGGELVLAGFYTDPISFPFPLAFMREARLRVAAEWAVDDLTAVVELATSGSLDLDDLITHQRPFDQAPDAYRAAFEDRTCLKMILDWRSCT